MGTLSVSKGIEKIVLILLLCLVITAFSSNCSKDNNSPTDPFSNLPTLTDIDGNNYRIVQIGEQWWMAENLKVTHYRNGDPIPMVADSSEWRELSSGAYCNRKNNENHVSIYGHLYNWYAIADRRNIAPAGWHVPTDEEWKQLEMYLGMNRSEADVSGGRGTSEGGKMKEAGTAHWDSPNTGATNESGFSALPGGWRNRSGFYCGFGYSARFWSSSLDSRYSNYFAWYRNLNIYTSRVHRSYTIYLRSGFSVRCVKN